MNAALVWAALGVVVGLRNASRATGNIALEQNFGRVFRFGNFHRTAAFTPMIVAATVASYWATAREFERNITVLALTVMINAVIVHIAVDIDTHLLLRRVNRRALIRGVPLLVIAAFVVDEPRRLAAMVAGGAIGWAVMTLLRVLSRGDLGGGDVSLCAMTGAFLGWVDLGHVPVSLVLGFVLGGVFALAGVVVGKLGRRTHIAFGPFLGIAAVVTLWAGDQLWAVAVG